MLEQLRISWSSFAPKTAWGKFDDHTTLTARVTRAFRALLLLAVCETQREPFSPGLIADSCETALPLVISIRFNYTPGFWRFCNLTTWLLNIPVFNLNTSLYHIYIYIYQVWCEALFQRVRIFHEKLRKGNYPVDAICLVMVMVRLTMLT